MPLYEYECESCRQRFERIQKFSDPPVETCPSCSGPVQKLLSSPAIQFKGSGWYITDYAKKGSGDSAKPGADAAAKPESKDAKPDAGSGSASTTGTSTSSSKADTPTG